jgi:hypothetical protein
MEAIVTRLFRKAAIANVHRVVAIEVVAEKLGDLSYDALNNEGVRTVAELMMARVAQRKLEEHSDFTPRC